LLCSTMHSSSTGGVRPGIAGINYSASDCFETFPFPKPDPRTVIPELETVGQELYEARARYMIDTNQGLTKTYNAIKDPACDDARILELRRLHEEMDRAVLGAYGWGDVEVPAYCPLSDEDRAAVSAFEDEVIDRLYLLNAKRATEEKRVGITEKKGGAAKGGQSKSKSLKGLDGASVTGVAKAKKPRGGQSDAGNQGNLF